MKTKAFKAAFPYTIPIFAGSIEFVAVNLLLGAFNPLYWFSGSTLGGILGSLIRFNTEGLEFVMTAMFVVIFMEQWLKEKNHTSALTGLGLSLLCLIAFGAENFVVPAMLAILGVLTLMRNPLQKKIYAERREDK